jgi:uncharacterized membrane protein YkvA (DUF1232 family)
MSNLEPVKAKKPTRKEKSEVKDRMKNFLMFLPNMVKLLGKLLGDGRVPTVDKALFLGAIAYLIMPLDFIPDFLPFIGQVDDTYLIALTLLRLINRTDESIVRQHWDGGGDVVSLANSIANIAPMLLPKRITRVLTSEVELTPNAQSIINTAQKKRSLAVEIPQPEKIKVDSQSNLPN